MKDSRNVCDPEGKKRNQTKHSKSIRYVLTLEMFVPPHSRIAFPILLFDHDFSYRLDRDRGS
jgi:hypothetical protein